MSARVATITKLGFAGLGVTLASAAFGLASPSPTSPAATAKPGAAAATTTTAAASATASLEQSRELFNNFACGSCHVLADAGASGHVGPSLDGNPNLTEALVVDRVANGQGPMPAFAGQLSDAEIAQLAAYVTKVAVK